MDPWRILTWNLHGSAQPNLALVAEVIAGYAPDVVALQEVQRHQAHHLAHRLGWRHAWARKHFPYSPLLWRRAEGLAVLSPHLLSDTSPRTLSPGVSTWTYRHRIVLATDVARGGDVVRVYDTHLSSDSADERIAQSRRLAAQIGLDDPPLAIVAGDLNAHDEVEVLREFRRVGLRDAGGAPTNPSIAPVQRLDYVVVPEAAVITDEHSPDGGQSWHELSDHLPVMVELRFAPSNGAVPNR